MTSSAPVPWRFQYSSTLKGIYVMRYGLFSGGMAIALAVLERAYHGRVGLGLASGLLVGLFVFRGQLRPFRVPALGLGKEQIHLVHRGKERALEWSRVRTVTPTGRRVALALEGPGETSESVELLARDYGFSAQSLAAMLEGFRQPDRRSALPPDAEVRRKMGVT